MIHRSLCVLLLGVFSPMVGLAQELIPSPQDSAQESLPREREEIEYLRFSFSRQAAEKLLYDRAEITFQLTGDFNPVHYTVQKRWQWSALSHEGLYLESPRASIQPGQMKLLIYYSLDGQPTGRPLWSDLGFNVEFAGSDIVRVEPEGYLVRTSGPTDNAQAWIVPATKLKPEKKELGKETSEGPTKSPIAPTEKSKATIEQFQGEWEMLEATSDGDIVDPAFKVVIQDNQISFTRNGREHVVYTIKGFDTTKTPSEIDLNEQGDLLPGIYELKGDTLRICHVIYSILDRPRNFSAARYRVQDVGTSP